MRRLAFLLFFAAGCSSSKETRTEAAEQPVQILSGFTVARSELGKRSWELSASTARLTEHSKTADLASPKMRFFKGERPTAVLTARTGVLQTENQGVRMKGDVTVRSLEDATTVETPSLDYDPERDLFHTEERVVVRGEQGVMRGKGMRAKSDLSEVEILEQTTRLP